MRQDLISLIVPVYNVEKYLHKCLESIVSQTYKNFEVLLINDGSTDNSGEICDEYCKRDNRFKVIHKKNEGVSIARNIGIEKCSGNWISFIDGDDFVDSEYLLNLYSAAIRNNADVVTSDFKGYIEGSAPSPSYYNRKGRVASDSLSGQEALSLMLNMRENCSVWSKIFKRASIGNLRFPIGRINEDGLFLFYLYFKTKHVVAIESAHYYYRINPNGLARTVNNRLFDLIINMREMETYLKEHNVSVRCKKALKIWEINYCTNLVFMFKGTSYMTSHRNELTQIRDIVKSRFWDTCFSKNLTLKNKIKSFLVYCGY